jgi:hypothetical protein
MGQGLVIMYVIQSYLRGGLQIEVTNLGLTRLVRNAHILVLI